MPVVRKKRVIDKNHHPVAVQIDDNDWLRIEQQLEIQDFLPVTRDLTRHAGVLNLTESPLAYQIRCRDEWT
ncbi:MAG: hypothetical protein H7829_13590 [Magnetococcus sp. THC-1_WYH]